MPHSSSNDIQHPANGFRTFLVLWSTQSISVIGSSMTFFAVTIWLTTGLYPFPSQKAALSFALAAIGLCTAVPSLLLAPIAGAWTDRHDRRQTMIWMNLWNGALTTLLAILMLTHHLTLVVLLPVMALNAAAGTFHNSAFDASYSMIVPEKQLPRANGMMQTVWSLSGIIAPMVAASLIAIPSWTHSHWLGMQDGTPMVMAIDAVTFFTAGTVLFLLAIPSPVRSGIHRSHTARNNPPRQSFWQDVGEGALYIWRRRPLLWLLATFTVANFAGAAFQVFPALLLKFNLYNDLHAHGIQYEAGLALLSAGAGIGGVLGGTLITAWGGLKRRRVIGVLVPLSIRGLLLALFGLSPWFWLTVAVNFLASFMSPISNAHSQTIWQTQTPRELQGRVFSVRRVIAQCTFPVGTVIAGWTAGAFNPGVVTAVFGTLMAVVCLAQFFNPYLLKVEDKAYLDDMASKQTAAL